MSEAIQEEDWHLELQKFEKRVMDLEVKQHLALKNDTSTVLLAHSDFNPYEGEYEETPYLMLNLCTAHVGRIRRVGSDDLHLEGVMRPGSVGIALPYTKATGFWPRTQLLGIAIDMNHFNANAENQISREDLIPAASKLHDDKLITAVMTALWRDAEVHGLSTPFFEHGLNIILNQLLELKTKKTNVQNRAVRPLKGARLKQVLDFIESRIGTDLRVYEIANIAEQDVRTFTRSFRLATGYAPYEYLTFRRMENAKQLLLSGVSVTEVAIAVGYSNPSKFSAAFRRVLGCSPSEWKQQ